MTVRLLLWNLADSMTTLDELRAKLPELPESRRDRFVAEYGLPLYDANLLTGSKEMADYHEAFIAADEPSGMNKREKAKLGSNWLLGEVSRIMNASGIDITAFTKKVSPESLARLTALNAQGVINAATAKSLLEEMFNTGKGVDALLKGGERSQINDAGQIEEAVVQAIAANPQAVADFKAGKETASKFLVGQVMRVTKGRANPQVVGDLIKKKLADLA